MCYYTIFGELNANRRQKNHIFALIGTFSGGGDAICGDFFLGLDVPCGTGRGLRDAGICLFDPPICFGRRVHVGINSSFSACIVVGFWGFTGDNIVYGICLSDMGVGLHLIGEQWIYYRIECGMGVYVIAGMLEAGLAAGVVGDMRVMVVDIAGYGVI